jgi:alpha-beta hydrolase superfamily lysophospholipase
MAQRVSSGSADARRLRAGETSLTAAERAARREQAERRRAARVRRRRILALALLALVVVITAALALSPGSTRREPLRTSSAPPRPPPPKPVAPSRPTSYAVGLEKLHLVEPGRTVTLPTGETVARSLETYVRYPAEGPSQETDVEGATPARADGPFPLVVFGHGYEETPETYKLLLQSWARAGFVVAAPAFPLEDIHYSEGANEAAQVDEPGDVHFLISHILEESASGSGRLAGLVNPAEVAVAGQSDGGDTALAVGYGRLDHDPRVKAVIVLSGAEGPFRGGIEFPPGSPPLLAAQGTGDPINHPWETAEFFEAAQPPKYLLALEGAEHLPPYTEEQPQLEIVERVTITFLYAYLDHKARALQRLPALGDVAGIATLSTNASALPGP